MELRMRVSSKQVALVLLICALVGQVSCGLFDFVNKNKNNNEPPQKMAEKETAPAAVVGGGGKEQEEEEEIQMPPPRSDRLQYSSQRARERMIQKSRGNEAENSELERIRKAAAEQARLAKKGGFKVEVEQDDLYDSDDEAEDGDDEEEEAQQVPARRGGGGLRSSRNNQPATRSVSPMHVVFRNDVPKVDTSLRRPKSDAASSDLKLDEGEEDDGFNSDDEQEYVTIDETGRRRLESRAELLQHKFVDTRNHSPGAVDKRQFKPKLGKASKKDIQAKLASRKPIASANDDKAKKSKFLSGSYWGKKMAGAYEKTKVAMVQDLPKFVGKATDQLSAVLQLDNRGRLLHMIDEVNKDIKFVRKEYSQFTLTWSPIMERALNYLGDTGLDLIKWNEKDELDHRRDALHSLAFGYEFMRMMISWRENLLVAHEAYKLYLETVKHDMLDKSGNKIDVDENFMFQLKTIHTYFLLTAWQSIDDEIFEPKAKLDHLMTIEDDQPKNYESEYFRNIVVLQEMYEPTIVEFQAEQEDIESSITSAGAVTEDLNDVDKFFDNFREGLARNEVRDVDWQVPAPMKEFLSKIGEQLVYNRKVYSAAFLKKLKQDLEEHMRKILE